MMDVMLRVVRTAILVLHVGVAESSSAAHLSSNASINNLIDSQINEYVITSIYPNSGPTAGGTDIILMGSGRIDGDELACVFESNSNSETKDVGVVSHSIAQWVSPIEIKCAAPEWDVAGANVILSLEFDGAKIAASPSLFHYYESPTVESIYPTFGSALGGTTITLRGHAFLPSPGIFCRLGVVDVPAFWKGYDEVACTSPPGIVASSHLLSLTLNGVDFSPSPISYRYTEPPLVQTIWPTKGSVVGGSVLTLKGEGFEDSPGLKCIFRLHDTRSILSTEAEFISSTELTCTTAAVEEPTLVNVHVTVNGVDASINGVGFAYIKDAAVSFIRPVSGPISGGTWVSLIGRGMVNGDSLLCRFGGSAPVAGFWISETEIQCILPRGSDYGSVNTTLSLNGVDYTSSFVEFLYFKNPTISSIYPTFGTLLGGTLVAVHGSGFLSTPDTSCRFGSIDVAASFINEEEVACVSPPGIAGPSQVSISLNGVNYSPSFVDWKYKPPPEVHAISPKWADGAGGTMIKVVGSGFEDTDELACIFGKRQVDPIRMQAEYASFNVLLCPCPPMTAPSAVALRVTANGVDISSNGVRLEYLARAAVSKMDPFGGPVMGGTPVILTGSGFLYEDTICCQFGDVIVPAEWISWTIVRCESPPYSAGDVVVSYSNDGMNFVQSSSLFSFSTPATVSGIDPTSGSKHGGTEVHIFGDGFTDEAGWKCLFGTVSFPAAFSSSSKMLCRIASASFHGAYALKLMQPNGHVVETRFMFHYYEDLQMISMFPEMSPISGGTTITIELKGLQLDSFYKCIFGGTVETSVTFLNNTFIECVTPQWDTFQQTTLALKSNSSAAITESADFGFYQPPVIDSASPTSFYYGFSTDFTLRGGIFINSPHSKCRLGKEVVLSRWISDHEIVCHYASRSIEPQSLELPLLFSTNGIDFHGSSTLLHMHPDLTVSDCSPKYGSMSGGTRVLVKGTGFADSFNYHCLFGTKIVGAELLSQNEIICESAPSSLPGHRSFWVCVDGGDCTGGEGLAFDYLDQLHLLDVSPIEGPISGGTQVRVESNHPFGTNSICSFGNLRVKIETSDSGFGVGVCKSPPFTGGLTSFAEVSFSISANGQEFSHEPFQFEYHPNDGNNGSGDVKLQLAVHISHISPAMGLPGTNITVAGSGFDHLQDAVCRFGSKQVPVIAVSNTAIICTAPWNARLENVLFNVMDPSDHVEIHAGNEMSFTFVDMPWINWVKPSVIVETNVSTTIEIGGHNIAILAKDALTCRVGSSKAPARFHNSPGNISCDLYLVKGSFPVELLSEQFGVILSSQVKIQVIDLPRLAHLEPPTVVAYDRNTDIMVKGENFAAHNLTCLFDDISSHATFISGSEALCRVPKDSKAQNYEVRLSNGGILDQSQFLLLEVIAPPSIAAMIPSIGETGSNISITGKAFHPRMECQFGGMAVETLFRNSTLVQCIAPTYLDQESVPVGLVLDGVPVLTHSELFFTFVDLSVNSISPAFGDISGGTLVNFNMKEDYSNVVSHCIFGEHIVQTIIRQSEIICVSPPMLSAKSVHVGVSINGEEFSMCNLKFEYTKSADFLTMNPKSGPESGGVVVTLTGSGFANSNEVACYFGDIMVAGQWLSDEKLTCKTPWMKPGNYTLRASFNGVDKIDTHQIFGVYPQMTTLLSLPNFGEIAGGTPVHVYGTNFRREDPLSCRFGSVSVDARYVGLNMVQCFTPKWEDDTGLVDFVVVSDNGDTAIVNFGFTFYRPFHVTSIHPSIGFTRGGTHVTVNGEYFSQSLGSVKCIFAMGDTAVKATIISDNQLLCTTPPVLTYGGGEFTLTHGADRFTLSPRQVFEYEDEIVLDAVSPNVVPSITDRLITVYGSVFKNRNELSCMISHQLMAAENKDWIRLEATLVHDSQISCRVPKGLQPGVYDLSVTSNGQDFSEATLEISIIDPFLVKSIHPLAGPSDTLPVVSIEGSNFKNLEKMACLIDEKYVVPSHFVNTTSIQCSLSLKLNAGAVSVALILDGVPISTGPQLLFTFIDLSVVSISPTFGDITGGTRVTFIMKEVSPDTVSHCIFGEYIAPSIIRQSELMCISPSMPRARHVPVGVSANGVDFSMCNLTFEYTKPAAFLTMHPRSGPETGGTVVTLTGSDIVKSNRVACYFGNMEVAGHWLSDEKLTCKTPGMKPGNYKVRVTLNGVDTLRISWQFTFTKEIDVIYASPSSGSILGGTKVSIVGKSFVKYTDNLTCQFGELGRTKAAFVSSTELTCLSPDISDEISDLVDVGVQLSLNGVDFSPAMARFRFTPPAIIHSIFPDQGSISGGTQVTVKGANMFPSIGSNTAMCIFGNESVPASVVSIEELACVSPPHYIDDEVVFAVTLNGGDLVRHEASTFLYLSNVKTMTIEPSGGPFSGGTLVTVRGVGIGKSSAIRCKFGSSYSDLIVHVSDEIIQCKSPPHPPGIVDFVIDSENGDITPGDVVFEFYKPPTILFAHPTVGPNYGETVVRIYGNDFRSNVEYVCYFGVAKVPGKFIATEAIDCSSPRIHRDNDHHVNLWVAEKNTNFTANTLHFSYVPSASLDYLRPHYVYFDGADSISLFGTHLNTTTDAWCRFVLPSQVKDEGHYYETVRANSVHDGHVVCEVPAYPLTSIQVGAFVEVSTNGWDWSASSLSFTYAPKPRVLGVHPSLGSVSGGTLVTVRGTGFLQESSIGCLFGYIADRDYETDIFGGISVTLGSTPAKWISPKEIACIAPAALYPANITLSLYFDDSTESVEGANFVYHRELSLGEASPMRGFVSGGTLVTIRGTGFLDVPTLSCQFGSTTVPATFVSFNSITCLSPPVDQAQNVRLDVSLNGIDYTRLLVSGRKMFSYDKEVDLFRTIPSNVPVSGTEQGYIISVIGNYFTNSTSLSCRFGHDQFASAEYIHESEIRCNLPKTTQVGEREIRISVNGKDFSIKKTYISFVEPSLISSVTPQRIQEGSATDILVEGENFLLSSDLQCRFGRQGHIWSPARWISDSSLRCMSPPLNLTHDGNDYIGVSNNGGHDTIRQKFALQINPRAQFLSMYPAVGYIEGGTDVIITLGNVKYISDLMCQFGFEVSPATVFSANRIACKAPPHRSGEVKVKLVSDGVHILATGTFEYLQTPHMKSLHPEMSSLKGGTAVSIYGTGFIGVTHCRFGCNGKFKTAPAQVESDFSLICDTPDWEENVDVLVQVSHNGQDFVGIGHTFSYRASPRLLSISPSFGGDMGGKAVYIMGENFVDIPTMCRFGTTLVDAIYISSMLLSCIAPELKIGLVTLSITSNDIDFAVNEMLYESIKLPQIKSMDPVIGVVSRNTSVVLKTTVLHKNRKLACHINEVMVPASYLSPNSAYCTMPTGEFTSVANVSISVDGERGMNSIEFKYVTEPKVYRISPNFGWTTGGAQVLLSLKDLEPFHSHEFSCSFGDSNNFTKPISVRDNNVACHLPWFNEDAMKQYAPILLRISDGMNKFQVKTPVFTYFEPAIVTKVDPPLGSIHGGSLVRVSGINFPNMFGLQCQFGDAAVGAEFLDGREIQCVSPEWKGGPKQVNVHIGIKGGSQLTLASHASFVYQSHPTVQSIHPKYGSVLGGTRVTLRGNALSWPDISSYLSCRFGNSTLVPVVRSFDEHELVCISPPLYDATLDAREKKSVSVSIYANHGQLLLTSSDDQFVYADNIEVGSLSPNSGPLKGGTIVNISAHGLHHFPVDKVTCHFGNSFVPASHIHDENLLRCNTPSIDSSASTKSVMVHLGINGLRDVTSIGQVFTYYRAPSITSIFPTYGFLEGGENVFVSGRFFRHDVRCAFGDLVLSKTVWLSDTSIICTSPVSANKMAVALRVTNNGMDYSDRGGTTEYLFTHRPDAVRVEPSMVQWAERTSITITGKYLNSTSACSYGEISETYPTFNITKHSVCCDVPPGVNAPLAFLPSLSSPSKIPIFLHLENGRIATGLEIKYVKSLPKSPNEIKQPQILSISPNYVGSEVNGWIRVYGKGFLNTDALTCKFGESLVRNVHFISAFEVRCRTPRHLPGRVSFDVINGAGGSENNFTFTFVPDLSILNVYPSFGSINGGTEVRVFGSFPSSLLDDIEVGIQCKFGMSGVVDGTLLSQNEITCLSPPVSVPETVEVRVSIDRGQNFAKSSSWFSYEHEGEVESLIPSYGYLTGGSPILIVGRNFRNSTGLKCMFGEIGVGATFLSMDKVSCPSPPHQMDTVDKVAVRLASEAGIGSSWKYFEYIERPQITSFSPLSGGSSLGEAELSVTGFGFRDVLQLMCAFGRVNVQARVIDTTEVLCPIPRHRPGVVHFHIIDRYALFAIAPTEGTPSYFQFIPEASVYSVNPTWNVTQGGAIVFVRGTNFDTSDDIGCVFERSMTTAVAMTDSLLSCPTLFHENKNKAKVAIGIHGSIQSSSLVMDPFDPPAAPNGTTMNHNITLCEPGTFQPQNGQGQCLRCPIGFMCPMFGLSKPILCPAGAICDRLGLLVPSSPCVNGHFCNKGTKMSSHIAETTTETWLLEEESGILSTSMSNSAWDLIQRTAPATGERRMFHPPVDAHVKAEQPFPCPIGFFCQEGVHIAEHREADYGTPQPCSDGYFCPRGSATLEGTGGCPTGFYCPTQILAIPCEIGHYCVGTANTSPVPCYPGSYSPTTGQSNCKLCEVGFQCPGFGRKAPELCQAGWVCDVVGLSIPEKRCPSGFVCEEGTTTDNPNSPFGVPPKACPAGSFCLEGVASDVPLQINWLPSFEMGALAPQPCQEGYYCPSNSSTPMGSGKCFPGHYCPENAAHPIQTPPGAFAGGEGGAIVGSLCLPGTFSPRPGQIICSPCPAGSSCLKYGTYVPRICGPGTYRSKVDSTQCKPCPERTYSFATGLTDISLCLPCAEGRVCGSQGMTDLKQSDTCSEGNVCGYMTDRATQFTNQCPSGSYCGNETTTLSQYSNHCHSGHYCERGTTSKLRTRDKCGKSFFCASGTPNPEPSITRCPRQTTSMSAAEDMDFCSPNLVAICDKMPFSETNPFDGLSYYPLGDASSEHEESAELLVMEKVVPFNHDSTNVMPWKNGTLEIFRTCPAYGILQDSSDQIDHSPLTVIGRNFRNSTSLTCRYRICRSSSWVTASGTNVTVPEHCRDEMSSNLSGSITKSAAYISSTRVACPMPVRIVEDDLQPLNVSIALDSYTQLCLRDGKGQMFLSQECSSSDLASGHCAFEDFIPSFGLRKRVYSLVVQCTQDEILNGSCDDIPAPSSKLNPCLTQRMIVDASNNGKKFSGDSTVVPYTSPGFFGDSHQVFSSYAFYQFIPAEYMNMLQLDSNLIQKQHLTSSFGADSVLCLRSSAREEGRRLIEDGWFESPYMSRFHLSFDWSHLPSHLVYGEHYKLAVYVVPSRCHESKCNDFGRSHSYEENVPCLQPVELPVWFTDESIDKSQMMNMTLISLDDSRFRVEVQIINGLAIPMANFFKKTMSVVMEQPQRANTSKGNKRTMSPFVSWEEKVVENHEIFGIRYDDGHSQQVSLPRNLPPRWKSFERGRVLIGMNTTYENDAPTIKDGNESSTEGIDFWDNPYQSASVAKQQSDMYFETFHGVSQDGSSGSYKYEHGSLILPYLPYFSNCREFDSYVPLWALVESTSQCQLPAPTEEFPDDWWRRGIPPLPHQDDINAIGPSDFVKFYPVADWCERNLHCNFEEDLPKPDVTPRWFEAESGTALFSIIRDPIDYYQYTGRESSVVGSGDGGGQKFIDSINTLQTFIPAKVDRSPSLTIEGGCTTACYPRKVTVDISYHQVDAHSKRIIQVKVLYDKFDKDSSNDEYELQVKFYALNYQELVIKFAFSRGLFLLLFTQIGVGTVVAAFIYWIVIRFTTNLERPPRLRITGFLWLTFPQALGGFLLGLTPIGIVTAAVFYLLKGYLVFTPDTDPEGRRWLFPSSTRLHYSDVNIDPDNLQSTRQGRTGLAFLTMALISFYFTSRMFVPKDSSSGNVTDQQPNARALVNWKRGNLICSSVAMSLFLVIIVEFSFWGSFGTYIWEAIIFMKILSIFVGSIVDKQLGEALLSAPVMTAMGLVQGIVTMSANDFMDFLLSYIVGFGFLIIERMYVGPLQAEVFGWAYDTFASVSEHFQASFPSIFGNNQKKATLGSSEDALVPNENNETVEPLLGSFASYSCDTLSLLYTPFIMVVIMAFSDEAEITKLYGIKEADMEYYVLFALTIIPFQIVADILLHNALELLHGWKMHEYLEYCRVRFQQREVWWKGLEENTLDECIEESLRSMDQQCFSSQYYMLNTIHVNAMIYFVMGVEMMTRAKYTVFGDPAMLPITASILLCAMSVKWLLTWAARMLGLWRIKHEKRGWHSRVLDSERNPNIEQWDDVQVDHDQHVMEQRITDQTFRYKFLNYNRSWILSQLPEMITPRITANQRPYMINQFARILGQVNGDISSDSDSDDGPEFETTPMTASTRSLARTWLVQANRRLRLKKLVQPLIQQSRGNECQICLSRNLLQVETLQSIEDIDEQFKNSYGTDEMDQVLFKRFWQRNQRYQTICLPCIQKRKSKEHDQIITDDRSLDDDTEDNLASDDLTRTSESILASWYTAAKMNVNQRN